MAKSSWIDVDQYKIDIRRGPRFRPPVRLGFVAFGLDGTQYELSILTTTDRPALARKILNTVGDLWPKRELQIKADDQRVITDIRKKP